MDSFRKWLQRFFPIFSSEWPQSSSRHYFRKYLIELSQEFLSKICHLSWNFHFGFHPIFLRRFLLKFLQEFLSEFIQASSGFFRDTFRNCSRISSKVLPKISPGIFVKFHPKNILEFIKVFSSLPEIHLRSLWKFRLANIYLRCYWEFQLEFFRIFFPEISTRTFSRFHPEVLSRTFCYFYITFFNKSKSENVRELFLEFRRTSSEIFPRIFTELFWNFFEKSFWISCRAFSQ